VPACLNRLKRSRNNSRVEDLGSKELVERAEDDVGRRGAWYPL
jgi:hypothetical protein